MIIQGVSDVHDGHGFWKRPFEVCHALALVRSSSGRAPALAGIETLAAYSSADVEVLDIMRRVCCW